MLYFFNKNNLSNDIIKFETKIVNYLIDNGCNSFSEKTKKLLINFSNCIEHMQTLNKCKINYVDIDNKPKINMTEPNLKIIDYIVIDKYIWDALKLTTCPYKLLATSKYSDIMKLYLNIGESYYKIISETNTIDWNIENTIINYNIGKQTVISNFVFFTLYEQIEMNNYTKSELIDSVVNLELTENDIIDAKKYLKSYINHMISNQFVNIFNGYLQINKSFNKSTLNLSKFIPEMIDDNVTEQFVDITNNEQIAILPTYETSEIAIEYLRLMLLTKMFKTNSTKQYPLSEIYQEFTTYLLTYIKSHNFDLGLVKIIEQLSELTEYEMIKNLTYLENRDIIEQTSDNSSIYVYVV